MNPTIYGENNSQKPCLSYNNKGIQRDIEKKFNKDLYKDVNDLLEKIIFKDNFIPFLEKQIQTI